MDNRVMMDIQQSLHGYQNGHQLLSSSIELTIEDKRTLLFQSDLSGPNFFQGFESYLTGYPLNGSNLYAFAKTWYADEMKRPGCVWTHTLLINFSDLGKIRDLKSLTSLFKRPQFNNYTSYNSKLEISIEDNVTSINLEKQEINKKNTIIKSLYEKPQHSILTPSTSSIEFENIVLEIWNDQWPRLRRNFSFCTGAFSLKKSNDTLFDLQVVPEKIATLLERQAINVYTVRFNEDYTNQWLNILYKYPKQEIKRFLWQYGADIAGIRRNFIPLALVFNAIQLQPLQFDTISRIFTKFFPSPTDAKLLKTNIFQSATLLASQSKEKDLLEYLISSEDLSFLDLDNLHLEDRLIKLALSKEISSNQFYHIWKNALPQRISTNIWQHINLDDQCLIAVLEEDEELLPLFTNKLRSIASKSITWNTAYSLQLKILNELTKTQTIDWRPYIYSILNSNSPIILQARKLIGKQVTLFSLDWLNTPSRSNALHWHWEKYIILEDNETLYKWMNFNWQKIETNIFIILFKHLTPKKISRLDFPNSFWLFSYKRLKFYRDSFDPIHLAFLALHNAFQSRFKDSEITIVELFPDVFSHFEKNQVDQDFGDLLFDEKESERDLTLRPILYFQFTFNNPKKTEPRNSNDTHSDILVEILIQKFCKYHWSSRSFLSALTFESAFRKAIEHCGRTQRGKELLKKVIMDIERKLAIPSQTQIKLLHQYNLL